MSRRRTHAPLDVYLHKTRVGQLSKSPGGDISFTYDPAWVESDNALPVSLSLPLTATPYRGAKVSAVFENLLPDSPDIRQIMAGRTGAAGSDPYSLLAQIGRDCVGALRFLPEGQQPEPNDCGITGRPITEADIELMIANLGRAPMGVDEDEAFRISVAGAQEKTSLLWHEGRWWKPSGVTPTTHLIKTTIGQLPGGLDLADSVDNEFFCLSLLDGFDLPVNKAVVGHFGQIRTLVVERFDRRVSDEGDIYRLPQEDFCQIFSVPSSQKCQAHGGPGITAIMQHLIGSETPVADRLSFFLAQVLFWLIGATDGHAKNFSVFIRGGGSYQLTPIYDVLSVEPYLRRVQVQQKQVKLAMSIGDNNHYRLLDIQPRHFVQTAARCGLDESVVRKIMNWVIEHFDDAFAKAEAAYPSDGVGGIPEAIKNGAKKRGRLLERYLLGGSS